MPRAWQKLEASRLHKLMNLTDFSSCNADGSFLSWPCFPALYALSQKAGFLSWMRGRVMGGGPHEDQGAALAYLSLRTDFWRRVFLGGFASADGRDTRTVVSLTSVFYLLRSFLLSICHGSTLNWKRRKRRRRGRRKGGKVKEEEEESKRGTLT